MRAITCLDELRKIQLDIMKEIHNFCESRGLEYYLTYGTLIGAVRHNGYIPWDDDIDIWMFREDYERFKKDFPQYGKTKHLYVIASDTKPQLLRNMMKVCDDRSLLKELQYNYQDDYGVFVDIWPLDGTPKNPWKRKLHNQVMLTAHRMFYAGVEKDEFFKGNGIKKAMRVISKLLGPLNILKFEEKKARKYLINQGDTIECYAVKIRNIRKEAFMGRELHQFEDTEFYIPVGYDEILTKIYGDYMSLPPKEEQVPHHIVEIYWLE